MRKADGRRARRAAHALNEIDQNRAVLHLVTLNRGKWTPCRRIALAIIQRGREDFGAGAFRLQQYILFIVSAFYDARP